MLLFPKNKFKIDIKEILIVCIPFILWLFLYRNFFLQKYYLTGDERQYYSWVKYYMDNIVRGIYPLWNPFFAWGCQDDFDMRFIGEFNPFLYISVLFRFLGMSFYQSYIWYLVIYLFIGMIGFYLIARRLFRDSCWASLAMTFLLFSSLSVTNFGQQIIPLICIPGIWFVYFLMCFSQTGERKYLLGLTFVSMIIATTYMPFHFLAVLLPFLLFFSIFFIKDLPLIFKRWINSVKSHKVILILCLICVGLSFLPNTLWYIGTKDPQYVMLIERGYKTQVPLVGISASSSASEASFEELFSDLDVGNTGFSNLPIFFYLILLLSIMNKGSRRQGVMFFAGFSVLLISFTDASFVFPFFYRHIFFFRFFRNYFFFMPLMMPFWALFAVEELRLFLEHKPKTFWSKGMITIFLLCVHIGFGIFLYRLGDIIWTSYATVAASLVFFVLYFWGILKPKSLIVLVVLFLITVIQPYQVTSYIDFFSDRPIKDYGIQSPQFSFVRPWKGEGMNEGHGFHHREKIMKDMSGFVQQGYFGVEGSFFVHDKGDHAIWSKYVRNKFYLYDHVQVLDESKMGVSLKKTEEALRHNKNIAYIFDKRQTEASREIDLETLGQAMIIEKSSDQFEILDFDLNDIKFRTKFDDSKFLVYNDSYHTAWKAYVNGKTARIFQANIAFKGIWLPAGENIVYFRYKGFWWEKMYIGLIAFFAAFLCFVVAVFIKDRSKLLGSQKVY